MSSEIEAEENLVAAAKQVMMALRSKKNFTVDTKKILAELCTELMISEVNKINEIEGRLNGIQEKIMNFRADQPAFGESALDESVGYLTSTVNEAQELKESLESLCRNKDKQKELLQSLCRNENNEKELYHRAQDVLQMAMERVEEEFKQGLVKSRFEPVKVSVHSIFAVDVASEIGLRDVLLENSLHKDGGNKNSNEFIIDLIPADVVSELRCIANWMFIYGFGDQCSQAYISVQKNALEECVLIPEEEKLNTGDVLKLDWESLNSKIKRWIQIMRIFVGVYLPSVKWLTEQIFGEFGTVNLVSFAEASMLQLLNFGKAMSQGSQKLGNLFPILDIYAVLADLLPDIDSLYSDDAGCKVRIDCREFLRILTDYARETFIAFVNGIVESPLSFPIRESGVCQLTVDVMNYLNALTGHYKTLKLVLPPENHAEDDSTFASSDLRSTTEEESTSGSSCDFSPVASHFRSDASIREWLFNGSPMDPAVEEETIRRGTMGEGNITGGTCDFSIVSVHFQAVTSILKCRLSDKFMIHNSSPLQHMSLFINIRYMVRKVKNSELRVIFGDQWIQQHIKIYRQHATNYNTATRSYRQTIILSRELLGKGTFGSTYKAHLDIGNVVAVKRLKVVNISSGEIGMFEALGAMYHENLVPLRAFNYTGDKMLLFYDYMEVGSLSALLHGNKGAADRTPLSWEIRFRIALGVARGIEYLHSQGPDVFHGNIKPSNVLLTESYDARVSDFGLDGLLVPRNRAEAHSMDHYFRMRQKADVYCFGVLLLELLTGKAAPLDHLIDREEWIPQEVDPQLLGLGYDNVEEETVQLLQLGIDCIAQPPNTRPPMSKVRSRIEELSKGLK